MTEIANNIAGSSDIMIKMDTDEFLMIFDNSTKAFTPTIQDYLAGYAKDKHHPLRLTEHSRFGYVQESVPSERVCSEDIHAEPDKFPLGSLNFIGKTSGFKGVWLSSKFFQTNIMNLGGHAVGVREGIWTDFGALHMHYRCLEVEVENCKRVLERHEYISASYTNKEAVSKLVKLLNCTADEICGEGSCKPQVFSSFHKAVKYVNWLHCPDLTKTNYYKHDGNGAQNLDFVETLRIANEKFGVKKSPPRSSKP